jgi:3-phenylpropionate/trans-cinnamate dioxygenase ferredoxin reductase subunit
MMAPEHTIDYLLIGGGLASATAAEAIRKRDPNGSILIVGDDPHYPYNRPPLSKEYLRGEIQADGTYGNGGIYVQLPAWYEEQRVELLHTEATALDTTAKAVQLSNGRTLGYGKLLLATGGRPRRLDIPGMDLPGVRVLRTLDDADALRNELAKPGREVVVIGSGFIGLETAANALFRHANVTIVEPLPLPLASLLPPALGQYLRQQFERRGSSLRYLHKPSEFVAGDGGRVNSVRIEPSGDDPAATAEELRCDLVLVGVGIQLNTELAQAAGLEVDQRHGIVVNERLQTSAPDIFAAGDVAAYPDPIVGRTHFEHWDTAIATGQTSGANMAGAGEAYRHVPYFFSDQFDLVINVLGYLGHQAILVVRGEPANDQFTTLFVDDGVLRGAVMINDDAQMDLLRELIAAQTRVPDLQALHDAGFDLASLKEAHLDVPAEAAGRETA